MITLYILVCTNFFQQESWSKDDKLQQCRFQTGESVDNAWFENCARCFYGQCILNLICDFCFIFNLSSCWVTEEALGHTLKSIKWQFILSKSRDFHGSLQPYCTCTTLHYYSFWQDGLQFQRVNFTHYLENCNLIKDWMDQLI